MTLQQALDRLRRECSRREYCFSQVERKLYRWSEKEIGDGKCGFTTSQIGQIMETLVKERYVDDYRYACAYVRDKARFSGWGPAKISYNLKGAGIEADVLRRAMEENGEFFAREGLEKILRKKWDSMKSDIPYVQKRDKVMRFALARGFSWNQIMEIIGDFR